MMTFQFKPCRYPTCNGPTRYRRKFDELGQPRERQMRLDAIARLRLVADGLLELVELAAVAGGLLPAQQRHRRDRAVSAVGLELFLGQMLGHDNPPIQTLPIPDL